MYRRSVKHIASIVLLAAYLPMVVLSSLHIHHETVDADDHCLQCAGHIESQHHHQCDCQYCHFLSLSYFGQHFGQSVVLPSDTETIANLVPWSPLQVNYGISFLRAPPLA